MSSVARARASVVVDLAAVEHNCEIVRGLSARVERAYRPTPPPVA